VIEVALERVVATGIQVRLFILRGVKSMLILCQNHMSVDAMYVVGRVIVDAFSLAERAIGGPNGNPVPIDDFVALHVVAQGQGDESFVVERVLRRGNRVSILGPSPDSILTIRPQVADDPPPRYVREQVVDHDVSSWTRCRSERLLKTTSRMVLPLALELCIWLG
jgi:hypothetical protein